MEYNYSNENYLLELLTEASYITNKDIQDANDNKTDDDTVISYLINNNKFTPVDVSQTMAYNANMEFVDLNQSNLNPQTIEAIDPDVARRYKVVPVSFDGDTLTVAISDPLNFSTTDSLPHVIPFNLHIVCATPDQIHNSLIQHYGKAEDLNDGIEEKLGDGFEILGSEDEGDVDHDDAPIIKLVTHILMDAIRNKASDIHIEPFEKSLRIRYRIDGVLHEMANHPRKLLPPVVSRLKIMSGSMSIAEKRLPQDGRIQVRLKDRDLDLRVSSVPSNHGESIVMRILDKSSLMLGLPQLGIMSDDQETIENIITLPDGIFLVTGPTGSGKTTTLYSCLNYINKPDKKIITVEDPVEYELAGINQVMVKEDIGMTFASALRSILRQAPNIIMIGEIRDMETASIAINASLTGHLVFSTLHTNDAPSAVARLTDIGIKPFLIASSIRAILAQRLVRKLCSECKGPVDLHEKEMRALNISETQAFSSEIMGPKGCEKCRGNGYSGRLSIIEIFSIDDEVRQMINKQLTSSELRKRAREIGMRTLREDGIRKMLAGQTSAQEVIKVTISDES